MANIFWIVMSPNSMSWHVVTKEYLTAQKPDPRLCITPCTTGYLDVNNPDILVFCDTGQPESPSAQCVEYMAAQQTGIAWQLFDVT